jgi:hypothetical protein
MSARKADKLDEDESMQSNFKKARTDSNQAPSAIRCGFCFKAEMENADKDWTQ